MMFDHAKFRELLAEREQIHSEWTAGLADYYKRMSSFIAENITDSIAFLGQTCTADEFVWLSEVFDDIARKSQSRAFIDCLYAVVKKFPEEDKKYNLTHHIEDAETWID
ncbi:MAG: hypothetical protein IJU53_12150 [Thermoguttaceae bacterium]|nr:hypothetical protein [Thermoguttaceae bacterium]